MTENEDSLQALQATAGGDAKKCNVTVSMPKTKSMVTRTNVKTSNWILKQVYSFNYLGVYTLSGRDATKEVRSRANKAPHIRLNDIVCGNTSSHQKRS